MGSHACFTKNGKAKCWGLNGSGQLGLGDTNNRGDDVNEMGNNLQIVNVGSGFTVNYFAIGQSHTCAHMTSNDLKCWGNNNDGRLGIGNFDARGDTNGEMGDSLPTVSLGSSLTLSLVVTGFEHTCVLFTSSKIKCFGKNQFGQLGYSDTTSRGTSTSEMGDSLAFVDLGTAVSVLSLYTSTMAYHNCVVLGSQQ